MRAFTLQPAPGAIQQHPIQHRPRINYDRMAHIEHHALLLLLINSIELTNFLDKECRAEMKHSTALVR